MRDIGILTAGSFALCMTFGLYDQSPDAVFSDAIIATLILCFTISASIYLPNTMFCVEYIKRNPNPALRIIYIFLDVSVLTTIGLIIGQGLAYLTGFCKTFLYLPVEAYTGTYVLAFFISIFAMIYYMLRERILAANVAIHQQELQRVELERLKVTAELDALQAKISPHFLFNSLNSIAGLIRLDPEKAEEMTLKLAALFRTLINQDHTTMHQVDQEMEIIQTYLDIEKIRFGERLNFDLNVDESVRHTDIPKLLIQPLVENSIKHGISAMADSGQIQVDVHQNDQGLSIEVRDNGPGFSEDVDYGYGLSNIHQRLNVLYPNRFALELNGAPGASVKITLLPEN